jgi:hypothetical protein
MHAYVIIYLGALAFLFMLLSQNLLGYKWKSQKPLRQLNLPLLFTAAGIEMVSRLYSLVKTGSGMSATHGKPFEFTARENLVSSFFYSHFPNFPVSWYSIRLFLILIFGIVLAIAIARPAFSAQLKPLLGPIGLIAVGLGVSAFVSLLSYLNGYWILSRQWVASMALCLLGTVWLFASISRIIQQKSRAAAVIFSFAITLALCLFAPNRVIEQARLLGEYRLQTEQIAAEWSGRSPADISQLWNEADVPNINIALGGSVWPVNACFFPVGRNCP